MNDRTLASINNTLLRIEKLLESKGGTKRMSTSLGITMGQNRVKDAEVSSDEANVRVHSTDSSIKSIQKDISISKLYQSSIAENLNTLTKHIIGKKTKASKDSDDGKVKTPVKKSDFFSFLNPKAFRNLKRLAPGAKKFKQISTDLYDGIIQFADKKDKEITNGISNFALFGEVFESTTKKLVKGTLTVMLITPLLPIVGIAIFGIAGMFNLLGSKKFSKNIQRGANSVKAISSSLVFLGLGLLGFSLSVAGIIALANIKSDKDSGFSATPFGRMLTGLGVLGVGILAIWGMSFVYSAIGSMGTKVILGAASVTLISISLVALGWGLNKFFSNKELMADNKWENFGFLAATIGSLGVEFLGLGVIAATGIPFLGVGLIAAIGGALYAMGGGLNSFYKTELFNKPKAKAKEDIDSMKDLFTSLRVAFKMDKLEYLEVKRGIKAVKGAGKALKSVSDGLKAWYKDAIPHEEFLVREDFLERGLKPISLMESITATLTAIEKPFAAIGSHQTEAKSVFGKLFNSRNEVKDGINAVTSTHKALESIATGLQIFKSKVDPKDFIETTRYDKDGKLIPGTTLLDRIQLTLETLPALFGAIGDKNNEAEKRFLGIKIKRGAIDAGVKYAEGMGVSLKNIADGLSFMKQEKNDYIKMAENATTFLSSYMIGMVSLTEIGDKKTGKNITNVLKDSNKYLDLNIKAFEKFEKLEKSVSKDGGLKTFNSLFTDLNDYPHDKVSQMFKDMRELIDAMKDMNIKSIEKQIELYEKQLQLAESSNKQSVIVNNKGEKTVVVNDDNKEILALLAMSLQNIKENISDMNDMFSGGYAKVKVMN